MVLVLDANEYIFAFGSKEENSRKLLDKVLNEDIPVRIPRTIFEEVKRNLSPETFREFALFINKLTTIDEDFLVPFELGAKYERLKFKPADAFIAAYTEWVGADILATENRHFLSRSKKLPFKVLNAENCLKILKK